MPPATYPSPKVQAFAWWRSRPLPKGGERASSCAHSHRRRLTHEASADVRRWSSCSLRLWLARHTFETASCLRLLCFGTPTEPRRASLVIGCECFGDGGGGRLVGELVAAWHPLRCVQSAAAQIPPVGGVPCTGRGVP